MPQVSPIHLHIERVVIDEAVHRAGPEAVRAAIGEQLPELLAAHGVGNSHLAATAAAEGVAGRISNPRRNP